MSDSKPQQPTGSLSAEQFAKLPESRSLIKQFSKAQTNGELMQWGLDFAAAYAALQVKEAKQFNGGQSESRPSQGSNSSDSGDAISPPPTIEEWMQHWYQGADLDKLEIPARIAIQIAKSYSDHNMKEAVAKLCNDAKQYESAEHWRTQEHIRRFGEGHVTHGSPTQVPSHVNCNWTGEEVEAYAALQVKEATAKLREERDALKRELQEEHEADAEIQEIMLKYQEDAESALAEVREYRRLTLNKFATLESALAEARNKTLDEAVVIIKKLPKSFSNIATPAKVCAKAVADLLALKSKP